MMILINIHYIWKGIGWFDHHLKAQAIGVPFPFFNRKLITIAMNQEKKCTKCGEIKSFDDFHRNKQGKNGLNSKCKLCTNNCRTNLSKTKKGKISDIYKIQIKASKQRGHNPPEYAKQELIDWCLSQLKFHVLYNAWLTSGFKKDLSPSCDRKDDSKGYSFDNIQLMTWKENYDKSRNDIRSGKLIHGNKPHKPVTGTHKVTGEVISFVSTKEAMRQTGISASSISGCCRKLKNKLSAGGYKWKFKN